MKHVLERAESKESDRTKAYTWVIIIYFSLWKVKAFIAFNSLAQRIPLQDADILYNTMFRL